MNSIKKNLTTSLTLFGIAALFAGAAQAQSNEKPATIHANVTYVAVGEQDCPRIATDFSTSHDTSATVQETPATLIMDFIRCPSGIYSVLKLDGILVTVHQTDMALIPQPAPTFPQLPDDKAPELKPIATLNGRAGFVDGFVGDSDNCRAIINAFKACRSWTGYHQDLQIEIQNEYHCSEDDHTYYHVINTDGTRWTVRDSNVFYTRPGTDTAQ